MVRSKAKKETPPVRLLGTMFLLVLGLVAVYVALALGIFALVQRLIHLEDASYTLLWPILILTVSAILGVVLAVFIFRGYLAPLSRLMQATQSVAEGNYAVRVELRGARGEVAEYIRSFNKMAEELSSVALLRMDFVNTFSHEFKTPLISIRGFARLLQSERLPPAQRREYTDTIIRESERLAAATAAWDADQRREAYAAFRRMQQWQQSEDSAAALMSLPHLRLEDVPQTVAPVQTQSRPMVPVFCGISGARRTIWNGLTGAVMVLL